jgi:hypothetical protein
MARNPRADQIESIGRMCPECASDHRRTPAETAMLRQETLIGPRLRARRFHRQQVEAAVALRCIDRFTAPGVPSRTRIA